MLSACLVLRVPPPSPEVAKRNEVGDQREADVGEGAWGVFRGERVLSGGRGRVPPATPEERVRVAPAE